MLIYLSKQSKFAERVAGKKGRIKKFSLREVGGGGGGEVGSNFCTFAHPYWCK